MSASHSGIFLFADGQAAHHAAQCYTGGTHQCRCRRRPAWALCWPVLPELLTSSRFIISIGKHPFCYKSVQPRWSCPSTAAWATGCASKCNARSPPHGCSGKKAVVITLCPCRPSSSDQKAVQGTRTRSSASGSRIPDRLRMGCGCRTVSPPSRPAGHSGGKGIRLAAHTG